MIINYWRSFRNESKYKWSEVDKIYLEKGYIRRDTREYIPENDNNYILIMNDEKQFDIDNNQIVIEKNKSLFIPNFVEEILFGSGIKNSNKVADFVSKKSSKEIIEVIKDAAYGKYIEK